MKKALLFAAVAAGILVSETPSDRAWSILTNALRDDNADGRAKAVRALGLIVNDERARQLGENSLSDPVADVRAAAADSLGQMNAKASAPKLFERMTTDNDAAVVFAAGVALYALDDPRGYEFYYAVLTGQRTASTALGHLSRSAGHSSSRPAPNGTVLTRYVFRGGLRCTSVRRVAGRGSS